MADEIEVVDAPQAEDATSAMESAGDRLRESLREAAGGEEAAAQQAQTQTQTQTQQGPPPEAQAQPQPEMNQATEPSRDAILDAWQQMHGGQAGGYHSGQQLLADHVSMQRQLQQQNAYAEMGRRYANQWQDFEAYLEEQQAAQQAQQGEPLINTGVDPNFDPQELRQFLVTDERTGMLVDGPYATPGTAHRYYEGLRRQNQFYTNFARNPEQYIGPMVENYLGNAVQHIQKDVIPQAFRRQAEWQTAASVLQNDAYLWTNEDGSINFPALQEYNRGAVLAAENGVRDPRVTGQLARNHLMAAQMQHARMQQFQQQQQVQAPQQQPAQLAGPPAAAVRSPQTRTGAAPNAPLDPRGKSFKDLFRTLAERNGHNPDDLLNQDY